MHHLYEQYYTYVAGKKILSGSTFTDSYVQQQGQIRMFHNPQCRGFYPKYLKQKFYVLMNVFHMYRMGHDKNANEWGKRKSNYI